jgi:hypothetical protein
MNSIKCTRRETDELNFIFASNIGNIEQSMANFLHKFKNFLDSRKFHFPPFESEQNAAIKVGHLGSFVLRHPASATHFLQCSTRTLLPDVIYSRRKKQINSGNANIRFSNIMPPQCTHAVAVGVPLGICVTTPR